MLVAPVVSTLGAKLATHGRQSRLRQPLVCWRRLTGTGRQPGSRQPSVPGITGAPDVSGAGRQYPQRLRGR